MKDSVEYKRFVWNLNNVINIKEKNNKIIFVCIGTNRIIGDLIGPYVGTILSKTFSTYNNIDVIGDNDNLVTYNNIEQKMKYINEVYKDKLIIVIDSALAEEQNIGKIFVQNRGLRYAESLKKKNTVIGDISIKVVVGKNANDSIENFKILNNISFKNILKMSYIVSNGIIEVVNKKENIGKNINI